MTIRLDGLPADILEQIIDALDLRTISRLSRTSKLLLRLTTTDSRWRKICKSLVGPWRLHPQVDDKYDWTLDPDCYPQSQFDNNPKSPAYYYPDWYTFTTRFLIPHFDFLGWHVSNISPLGQLILITYDTNNGRLVAQEIKCKNIYSLRTRTRQTTTDPGQPTDNRPTWPTWLPLNSIQIYPNQTEYNLVNGPNRFSFDIFKPVFEFSPFFEIVPIEPHYRLSGLPSDYEHITLQKPELVRRPWNDLGHRFTDTPFFEPTKLIGSRTNILSRSILDNGFDLVTHANQEEETEFCSITLASSSSRTTTDEGEENPATIDHEVANRDEGRIRYQGGRGGTRRGPRTSNILLGGRTYTTNRAGTLRPVVDLPIEYYPYNGPFPHTPSKPAGIHGLWVGTYGSHGTEFGHLMSQYDSSSGQNHIYFVKITGDLNVPAGQISWKFACLDLDQIVPVSIDHAISGDLGNQIDDEDDGHWMKGLGQVANTNYEEPGWINTKIQFITNSHYHPDHFESGLGSSVEDRLSGVDQIRVKWIELGKVSTFFKVDLLS
ncbi:hypothetical protein PSTG_07845 [Puccinia striiformis f. sp. tritici PST-78]|uniref:F-box domain-containing protein n=1 Tax=Puccinia striiformis f. sp. tritici PST-78 TaxID=1165861 RepID=A0A0L0VHT4_9BASI|nr:hypothetical protein PSTG_07845 [Puccinia striiformis f. sp. tritici PST-78]